MELRHGGEDSMYNARSQAAKNKLKKGTAKKSNPALWEKSKKKALKKMGGKHSARAMQLATNEYQKSGGGYEGKEPTAKTNKLKQWEKKDKS